MYLVHHRTDESWPEYVIEGPEAFKRIESDIAERIILGLKPLDRK